MAVFKFKPLGQQKIKMLIMDEGGNVEIERVSEIGQYLDVQIPTNGSVLLTGVPVEAAIEDAIVPDMELQVQLGDPDVNNT